MESTIEPINPPHAPVKQRAMIKAIKLDERKQSSELHAKSATMTSIVARRSVRLIQPAAKIPAAKEAYP
jgi:hypothetical protein